MTVGIDYPGITTVFFCNDGMGNFLLHKRSARTRDEQGTWVMGGGKLEFGSSLEENVLKEVAEEYGCRGIIQEQLPATAEVRFHDGAKTHWVVVPFFIKIDPAEAKNNEPEKIDEIGWFTLDNLPRPLHSGLERELQRYQDYFLKYKQ